MKIPEDADTGLAHINFSGILKYEFDKVFDVDVSQSAVFEDIAKDKILDLFDGINSTIFAYGQTGSGEKLRMFNCDKY